ncbi:MAG TPA: hypothetical protein VGF08_13840 [Terriglobales bacterium]
MVPVVVAFLFSLFAFAQYDQTKQDDSASGKAVSVSGKVSDDGKTITDKDNKAWTVANPDQLKGQEGKDVTVKAQLDPTKNEIRIVSVKGGKNDMKDPNKKDDMPK